MAKNISRQINLLERYNGKKRLVKKESGKKKSMAVYMTLVSAVLAAGLGCVYFHVDSERTKTDNKLYELQNMLSDGSLRDQQVEASRYIALNTALKKKLTAVDTVKSNIEIGFSNYSYLVDDLYAQLDTLCGKDISIIYYSLYGNALSLTVEPRKPNQIADFVIRAEESGLFSSVSYHGFSSGTDEDENEAYTFSLECLF